MAVQQGQRGYQPVQGSGHGRHREQGQPHRQSRRCRARRGAWYQSRIGRALPRAGSGRQPPASPVAGPAPGGGSSRASWRRYT